MRSDDGGPAIHAAIAPDTKRAAFAEQIRSVDPAHFDAWVQSAQPGARVIYGMGIDARSGSAPGVAKRMRALGEVNLVRLHYLRVRKDDRQFPFDFIAVRTRKPVPKGFPLLGAAASDDQRAAARGAGKSIDAWLEGAR